MALLNQTGNANKTHAIGVTDDGGTVTLKTSNGITAITAIALNPSISGLYI